ncbi:mTERF domain-containing protein, mitochondrial [Fistulifera solaris]|uniref:mTERF domain-containing protein, mitochondrial n=1 Tax=Fistulifera solaris TaxID=1519565 RepID=A0A1Z5JR75_FISSO|nr:mTERF domain-containing protein, mitochondrial [Fistulifera solaris]|eukprot:GAX16525.1 mTERF domain-containing protein, mitochondrial [Fistulifera solaris]
MKREFSTFYVSKVSWVVCWLSMVGPTQGFASGVSPQLSVDRPVRYRVFGCFKDSPPPSALFANLSKKQRMQLKSEEGHDNVFHIESLDDDSNDFDAEDNETEFVETKDNNNFYDDDDYSPLSTAESFSLETSNAAGLTGVSYFYLRNELGLSEEAMWRITYQAGSALGMTANTVKKKVEVLRQRMSLGDKDIRSLLERQPTILHLHAERNIGMKLDFLAQELDADKQSLRELVLAAPSLINYSATNLERKVRFFTKHLGFTVVECRHLWTAEPKLVYAGVQSGLIPRMKFFLNELGLRKDQLRGIIKKNPRLLLYSVDMNLIPKLVFHLILTLNMEPSKVRKIILSYPNYLDYNLDDHILPITRYFIQDLEYSSNEFSVILYKFPRVMTNSLRRIKSVVGYLRYQVGLSGAQVKRLLYQSPQIVSLRNEHLHQQIESLQLLFDLSDEEATRVMVAMPTLLVLSVSQNLEPKRTYLLEAFGDNRAAVKAAVLRLPTLLGYSLEKRIRPRVEAILDRKLDPSIITVGIPMTQDNFDVWLMRKTNKIEMRGAQHGKIKRK